MTHTAVNPRGSRIDPRDWTTMPRTQPPPTLCIFTSAHQPDDVRVQSKFAQFFLEAGIQVTWIGPGEALPGNGVEPGAPNIRYLLVPAKPGLWNRVWRMRKLKTLLAGLGHVDFIYAPDPDSAKAAGFLAPDLGARVIFDIHEIYHEGLMDRLLAGRKVAWLRAQVQRQISRTAGRAHLVIGVSDSVLSAYLPAGARHGLVVRSCAPAMFADHPQAEVCAPGRERFRFMHGKNHPLRGTGKVLEALEILAASHPRLQAVMFHQGDAPSRTAFEAELAARGVADQVEVLDNVPLSRMPEILHGCDLGLIAYDRRLGIDSLPNRIFEYMALGIPVLAPSYSREIAKIVQEEACGLTVDFEDASAIAKALVALINDPEGCRAMGLRGRKAFLERHNWEVEFKPVLEWIQAIRPREA